MFISTLVREISENEKGPMAKTLPIIDVYDSKVCYGLKLMVFIIQCSIQSRV